MTRDRLRCFYCGQPIRRQPRDPGDGYTQHTDVATGLERAWHMRCGLPISDAPVVAYDLSATQMAALDSLLFQDALNTAKLSIAMGMALPVEGWEAFRSIVGKALDAQRQG